MKETRTSHLLKSANRQWALVRVTYYVNQLNQSLNIQDLLNQSPGLPTLTTTNVATQCHIYQGYLRLELNNKPALAKFMMIKAALVSDPSNSTVWTTCWWWCLRPVVTRRLVLLVFKQVACAPLHYSPPSLLKRQPNEESTKRSFAHTFLNWSVSQTSYSANPAPNTIRCHSPPPHS